MRKKPGATRPRTVIQIPDAHFEDDEPHFCFWECFLSAIEARHAGESNELIWQSLTFRCGVCNNTFKGNRTYDPKNPPSPFQPDLMMMMETRQLVIYGEPFGPHLFSEWWPQTIATLSASPYLSLKRDVFRAVSNSYYYQGEHDDDEFRKCKRCSLVFGYRDEQCAGNTRCPGRLISNVNRTTENPDRLVCDACSTTFDSSTGDQAIGDQCTRRIQEKVNA